MRPIFSFLLGWLLGTAALAQAPKRFTISGYIREMGSREALLGAAVRLENRPLGTQTNTFGFYSITLPEADSVTLLVSLVGYQSQSRTVTLRQNLMLSVDLLPGNELEEVVVSEKRGQQRVSDSPQMSQIDLPIAQIKKIPALLGEKDVLKVLQLMPGVQKGSEGQSGLYVRGGGPDQNLIVLDDAVVYNASHLFGFFSVFNGDALKSVELTKGGFPARYGGRLSSVLDLTMKDGARDTLHGDVGIGLIASRILVEGPLTKGTPAKPSRSSFIVSARRTYLDIVAAPIIKAQTNGETTAGYYFYDLNAKLNYDLGPRDRVYVSGYFGRDKFYANDNTNGTSVGLGWGNATATLRWNHQLSQKLFANTSLIFSKYQFDITSNQLIDSQNRFVLDYTSGIRDFSLKHDLDYYPVPNHALRFGVQATAHRFTPSAIVLQNNSLANIRREVDQIDVVETGVYGEDTWKPDDHWRINGGLRISSFTGNGVAYVRPEPRLSLGYLLRPDLSVKASYALMNQYVHLLSNTGIGLPTDLWVPTTDAVKPQQSQQVAVGVAKDFATANAFTNGLALTVEAYYKRMDNIINYREGASFLLIDDPTSARRVRWEDNVTVGKGWSYGAEVLLQKKEGRFSGWVGYTLSWTQWQFAELNNGNPFYPRYDRRHDISVVGMYDLNPRITISATWVYGTGQALTVPTARYRAYGLSNGIDYTRNDQGAVTNVQPTLYTNGGVRDYGPEKNTFRAEPYHRLDLGVQFHRKRPTHESVWEVSFYNAYNRRNPFFYNIESKRQPNNQPDVTVLYKYSVFPVVPSVSYSYKF
ncbi:TonB-dependent receptor [Fibrella aquatilis]|uniref:TonB-dependent receptor n=1 Tax=Fibrella aquatilis TaxID=2817059 RepID=A0A939JXU8_9BACT|nr:TonB-dependent receptor [Fibrella aquatilis]MBO0931404.1 TonB-dependent receptor [Fibrella aquatilis]